jgi:hypothetical protein
VLESLLELGLLLDATATSIRAISLYFKNERVTTTRYCSILNTHTQRVFKVHSKTSNLKAFGASATGSLRLANIPYANFLGEHKRSTRLFLSGFKR